MGPLDLGDLSEFRKFQTNASSTPATSVDNSSPGNNGGMVIRSGRLVPKNAPTGAGRFGTGLADWATFGVWDFDNRGNLTNFGDSGSMHTGSGFGQSGDGIKTDALGNVVDTKRDASGQVIGTGKTKEEIKAEKEKQEKIEAEKRREGYWNKRVDREVAIAKEGQNRQMIHGGLTGMGKSIMEGTIRGVDSLDRAQAATAQMVSNMPTLQLTAMKYAQGQNYGLG